MIVGVKLGEWVAAVTLGLTVGAVLLYGTGWFYAAAFFEQLHVGLIGLDLPREFFFVYGTSVALGHGLGVTAAAVLVGGLMVGLGAGIGRLPPPWNRRLPIPVGSLLAVALLLLAFAGLRWIARDQASADFAAERASGFAQRPAVELTLAGTGGPVDPAGGCHRLMLKAADHLILVRPLRDMPDIELATLVLPADQVTSLRLTRSPLPCP